MKLPKKWLCEYVDFNVSNEEFIERMMWRGFELAALLPELPNVSGVVTGRVCAVKEHTNSNHLQICDVDVGGRHLQIVTGAPNVFAGAIVPVAVEGAVLGSRVMAAVNMRGVESYGMMCSGSELGLTDADYPGSEVDGLLIMRDGTPLGQPIAEAVGLGSVIFDFDITPNRADCNSMIGICREAAAALGQTFREPQIKPVKGEGDASAYASVTVENTELCPRYTARVVRDIRIAPSPEWMQKRLHSMGMRPINNIVDITNYVLLEYGHPMHAFDLSCITDGHIIVRNAHENEQVVTLDGKTRVMESSMLLIADPTRGVGIAGVMGGENSEITQNTKTVLFESAVFKSSNIRATARTLRHVTDSAARFIKGVEAVNAQKALDRAIELVEMLDAGTVIGEPIDVCHAPLTERVVSIDTAHVNRLLGLALTPAKMTQMLESIGITASVRGTSLDVRVPHYRTDIEDGVEADHDIAEEIARVYGYYNIEPTLMRGATFAGSISEAYRDDDRVVDTLVALGAYEMYNYNFTGPAALKRLMLPEGDEKLLAVRLLNPFGEDQSLMRTTLYLGMLDSAARNLNRRTEQGRFFELGNVHFDNSAILPEERRMAGLIFFGEGESFFTLKGAVEELLSAFGIRGARYVKYDAPYFQPGQGARVYAQGGRLLGEFGAMHPDVIAAYGQDCRIYAGEFSVFAISGAKDARRRYAPLPRYPVVLRDLAVVTPLDTESAALAEVIRHATDALLIENVRLFDSYCGVGILPGFKSLAYSFSLRAEDHTLTDDEIRSAMDAVILALGKAGAPLRQ